MTTLTHKIELPLITKLVDLDNSYMGSRNHKVGTDNISSSLVFMPITLTLTSTTTYIPCSKIQKKLFNYYINL